MKDFLRERNISYKEFDVSEDIDAAQEMIKKTGQMGVPVTEINGEFIIGFNRAALEGALKEKSPR